MNDSRQRSLPEGWMWAKVSEVGAVTLGRQRAPQHHNGAHMRPYLRVANVFEDRIDDSNVLEMNFSPKEYEVYKLEYGDILLNEGQSLELVGRPAMYRGEVPGACFQNTLVRFRSSPHTDPRFALIIFRTYLHTGRFQRIAKWTTNIAHLGAQRFAELEFPLAPLAEQQRIVDEIEQQFTRLDAAVAALERVRANLKRYRAAVLKAAVEGRLVPTEAELARAEGREYEPAEAMLARIESNTRLMFSVAARKPPRPQKPSKVEALDTSLLPRLPEGWCWARVREIGTVALGRQRAPQHHSGPHMRPYLRVANVFEDRIDTSDVMSMNFSPSEYETYRLEYGDILLNEGQSLELVGRAAMFRGEIKDVCFQNTLVRFRINAPLSPQYTLLVFRAYLHDGRFQRIARWTTNIAHLGAERFGAIEVPIPPLAEQHRIVAEVERRLSVVEAVQQTVRTGLKRAARLRQAILRRAFEGKLVPQDPTDEPARILLERIRAERAAPTMQSRQPPRMRQANGHARAKKQLLLFKASAPSGLRVFKGAVDSDA